MIQALFLDFDGLLMDTETPEVEAWQKIYAEYGVSFPMDIWLRDVVGSTLANFDVAAYLAQVTGRDLDTVALHEQVRRERLRTQAQLSAMPGVSHFLTSARALGLRLAVVSSSPHAWVDGYLRQLRITDFFETVVCREDAPRFKPAPDLYLEALHRFQLSPRQAIAFEDSPNGVLAAKRAGLRVVGVPNPVTAHAGRLDADLILRSLDELPLQEILVKLAG
ncbi:MAG: HAD-IA family hydrolase [Anaerolineales bacterium]|nr:HAD-IA family hydrolase [Anaerolineales bacterium]MCX7609483.1 HAD-IA family hydrolase [Anaerolineales bacterium]MDW8227814.1 HAD-IA family hydrolase [Anaerolineales bacterium]